MFYNPIYLNYNGIITAFSAYLLRNNGNMPVTHFNYIKI